MKIWYLSSSCMIVGLNLLPQQLITGMEPSQFSRKKDNWLMLGFYQFVGVKWKGVSTKTKDYYFHVSHSFHTGIKRLPLVEKSCMLLQTLLA